MSDDVHSLGEQYKETIAQHDEAVRQHSLSMPNISGSSIGSAYEAWFEADQESHWLANLDKRRELASSDETTQIPIAAIGGDGGSKADAVDDTTDDVHESVGSSAVGNTSSARTSEPERSTSSLMRSSALMAAGTLVSRVLGLGRSALTVSALGVTGAVANTWDVSNTLPNIIYLLLAGGVINAVLVPQITRALEHEDGGKAYTDRIVTLTLTLLTIVTVAFMAAAPLVYRLFDNNHMTHDKAHVAWVFSLITLPQIFFYGVYTILGQILNARGKYGAFMWSPALANIVIIIGLIWFIAAYPHGANVPTFSHWSLDMMLVLALPATIGIAVQAAALWPALKRAGYSFTPNFTFRGVGLRSASQMAGWAFAAVIVQQVGLVITTQLLSSQPLGAPGKASQSQAFLLFTLPHSLITLSLVTALFTRMSVAAGRGETDKVKEDMTTGIRLSGIASVMLTFGCFAVVYPLAGTMFGTVHGAVWSIGSMAISMMIGLVPYSLCLVIQRVFYAYNDAKTPFRMQIICTGVAILLTLPWFDMHQVTHDLFGTSLTNWRGLQNQHMFGQPGTHWLGVGVGLAQTLSNVVQAAVGFVLLQRKIGHVPMSDTIRSYVRMAVAALVATVISGLVYIGMEMALPATRSGYLITLLVVGPLFLITYFALTIRLRVAEIHNLLGPVMRRVKRA